MVDSIAHTPVSPGPQEITSHSSVSVQHGDQLGLYAPMYNPVPYSEEGEGCRYGGHSIQIYGSPWQVDGTQMLRVNKSQCGIYSINVDISLGEYMYKSG